MFTDINVSEDLNEKFVTFCRDENHQLGIDFSILVLQAGAWPISQTNLPSFSLPQELEKSVRAVRFKHNFYREKNVQIGRFLDLKQFMLF